MLRQLLGNRLNHVENGRHVLFVVRQATLVASASAISNVCSIVKVLRTMTPDGVSCSSLSGAISI